MGKKIRCQYLTGALLEPYFHFINRVEFGINPVSDPRGTRIAEHIYKSAVMTRPLFKPQKFTSSLTYDLTSNNSWAIFTYLNGMRQGIHLKNINLEQFTFHKKLLDSVVECKSRLIESNALARVTKTSTKTKSENDSFTNTYLSQYNRANLVSTDSDRLSHSDSQLSEYQAMSTSTPAKDLLLCSVYYRCALCNVSLTNFTRLITLSMKANEEGFSNYCAACFAGSSPTHRRLDNKNHPKSYRYFAIPPFSNQFVAGEAWSLAEISGLFQAVERFGIDNWKIISEQFSKIVGINRKDNELKQKFLQIMKRQQIWKQKDIEDFLNSSLIVQKELSQSFTASKKSEQQRVYNNNFIEMMKNHNIYDDTQFSNDNYHQYYLKLLIDSKQVAQKYSGSKIQKITPDYLTILNQIEQFRELSAKHEENTGKAQDILYRLYFNALGREDKYQRSFSRDVFTENIGVENDDLEFEKLKSFEGLENVIEDLMQLKVKRSELLRNNRSSARVSFASKQSDQHEADPSKVGQQKIRISTPRKNKKRRR